MSPLCSVYPSDLFASLYSLWSYKGMEHLYSMKCKNKVPLYDLLLEMLDAHRLRPLGKVPKSWTDRVSSSPTTATNPTTTTTTTTTHHLHHHSNICMSPVDLQSNVPRPDQSPSPWKQPPVHKLLILAIRRRVGLMTELSIMGKCPEWWFL